MEAILAIVWTAMKLCFAPLYCLVYRPNRNWSYGEAIAQRILQIMTTLPLSNLRWLTNLSLDRMERTFPPTEHVKEEHVEGFWYGDPKATTVVLHCHGGGFVLGDARQQGHTFEQLEACRIFSLCGILLCFYL